MSFADEIAAGPKIREMAEWLLAEWASRETSPFLRDYLDTYLRDHLPAITGEGRHMGIVYHDDMPFALWCMRPHNDDTAEVLGPFVAERARRHGAGSMLLATTLNCAATMGFQSVAMPVNAEDRPTHEWLERRGLFEIPRYREDPGRTHVAFGCDLAEQAAFLLAQNGVPNGRGKWLVVANNDDSTPVDFVIDLMCSAADLRWDLAEAVTRNVHLKGRQVIRHCRTRRGANRLAEAIERPARACGHPLQVRVEQSGE